MKKVFAVSLLSLMLAVGLVGVADAQSLQTASPGGGRPGTSFGVTVTGQNFTGTTCTVDFSHTGITAENDAGTAGACDINSPTQITFDTTIASTVPVGTQTMTVGVTGATQNFTFTVSETGIAPPERTIPTGITTAQGFIDAIRTLTDWLFVILVVVAVIFIVLAGLQFITGGGDPTAVSQARTKLIWAAVGIGVALLARGLPEALQNLIGA